MPDKADSLIIALCGKGGVGKTSISANIVKTLISDASKKGLEVAKTILNVADKAVCYQRAGLIVNRLHGPNEYKDLSLPESIDCLGWVPEDDTIRQTDIDGSSLLEIEDGPAMEAVRGCLAEIGIDHTKPARGKQLYDTTGAQ